MTKEELGRIQARGAEILKYLEVVIDRANGVNDLNVSMMRIVDPDFIASVWVGELVLANLEKDGLKTDKKFPDIKEGNLLAVRDSANELQSGGATKTEEKRSFGGYTCDISKCERYTREEALKGNCVSTEEATKKINWKKMFKSVDSFYIRVDRLEELTGYRAATSFYQ